MTVYDIPNIKHCVVTPVTNVAFRIIAHEGWYIHQADIHLDEDENGNVIKIYKGAAVLRADYDFSLVEITEETDLPCNAVINGY